MNARPDEEAVERTCEGCTCLTTFKPRPDEQKRYGFTEVGHGCRSPGWEGYIINLKPVCVYGPYLTQQKDDRG